MYMFFFQFLKMLYDSCRSQFHILCIRAWLYIKKSITLLHPSLKKNNILMVRSSNISTMVTESSDSALSGHCNLLPSSVTKRSLVLPATRDNMVSFQCCKGLGWRSTGMYNKWTPPPKKHQNRIRKENPTKKTSTKNTCSLEATEIPGLAFLFMLFLRHELNSERRVNLKTKIGPCQGEEIPNNHLWCNNPRLVME